MYGPRQLLTGIRNPRLLLFELFRIVNERRAVVVMDEDWDNLLILDACRYDVFEKASYPDGQLSSARSLGSKTGEFLKANFNEPYPDTVYVSANPQIQLHDVEQYFCDTMRLWETHWDEELGTVRPETVVEQTLATQREYPNKRLIVHFVQPHYPFIGDIGRQIEHGSMIGDGIIDDERSAPTVWEQLKNGALSEETAWQAYVENLDLILPHVKTLLDDLIGKSVVTSDHGNAFGEWGIYGHPAGRHIPELVTVPWLITESAERKTTEAGTISTPVADKRVPDEQLRNLGYKM